MFTIMLDGKPLYSPAMLGDKYRVLAPKLTLDINTHGALSFVLPPGNRMHGEIRRRKGIVTVFQDGEEIFRGRVMDDHNDSYNQKSVYCEGVRGYLNDSQAAPYKYQGTPRGLIKKLVDEHNAQVEDEKRFVLGNITIDRADEALECENVAYWETFREIEEKLLSAYGGYLRVRAEGDTLYLDWLKEYGRTSGQKIRFAVNLIDLKDRNDSADMFTILRPLGASVLGDDGEYGDPVTIASVNGGSETLEDDASIREYGRIYRTHTWLHIEDPAELLKKAQEYMKIGAELRTITLQAVDMHFRDGSIQAIRAGDKVHIVSEPHGIDLERVCSKIEIDLIEPDKTIYTFGEARRALTDNFVKAEEELAPLTGYGGGGGRGKAQEQIDGIIRWAKIQVDQANANIQLLTGEANLLNNRLSKAEIELDGINAQIVLKASQEEVDDLGARMSAAEVEIDGANAQILLKASQTEVDDLGERVSSAEIEIDGMNSEITLKADKVYVDAQITEVKKLVAQEIDAAIADLDLSMSETIVTDYLTVKTKATISALALGGSNVSKTTLPIVTSITQALGESSPTKEYTLLTVAQ